jgi:outer membrane protein
MKFYKLVAVMVVAIWTSGAVAEGRIAVFDVEAAVLNTDMAKKRLTDMRNSSEYEKNVKELESLKKNYDKLVEQFQKDFDILSANQQEAQSILQELGPQLQKILPQLVKDEKIGLLLPRKSVLHADADYDITAKVADKLNQAK